MRKVSIRKTTVNLKPLFGGCRFDTNTFSIRSDEAYRLINCHINEVGITYSRGGSRKVLTSTIDGEVTSQVQYNRKVGSVTVREILVTIGEKWYKVDGTGLTQIGSLESSNKPSIVTFHDGVGGQIAILANGVDFKKYDGTSVSDLLPDFAGTFPTDFKPKYLYVYDGRLWTAGMNDKPTRAHASGLRTPLTWDSSDFFSYDERSMEPLTGLSSCWSYLVACKKDKTYINTEGNPQSTTVQQILVADGEGTSSHWSIVPHNNMIFFYNEKKVFSGELRAAVEDGLVITEVSHKIKKKLEEVSEHSEVEGVYDPAKENIYWGLKRTVSIDNWDLVISYNVKLSSYSDPFSGKREVWNGWWDGEYLNARCLTKMVDDDGDERIYRAGTHGNIYKLEGKNVYKDEKSDGNKAKFETLIHLGQIAPGGVARNKTFRQAVILLYQNVDNPVLVNGTTKLRFNVDNRFQSENIQMTLNGVTPYWNDGDNENKTSTWGGTLWLSNPMMSYFVDLGVRGKFITFIIENTSDQFADEIAYGGGQVIFQYKSLRR